MCNKWCMKFLEIYVEAGARSIAEPPLMSTVVSNEQRLLKFSGMHSMERLHSGKPQNHTTDICYKPFALTSKALKCLRASVCLMMNYKWMGAG